MARTQSRTNHTSSQQTPESSTRNGAASRNSPTQEQIARRAYELFLSRGAQHGRHEDDWLQAERELKLGR
ncbi:DUF2934 domain-containing protein [Archangium lipolyticum]|uniref:DUF2934 domain-containing protein n=1 Tax=Archangium lipolyticum TaxID=2970465 RepID=UPI002149CDBC|nr:DUF2934 domain-containing protein [Archangium lipolyticum]